MKVEKVQKSIEEAIRELNQRAPLATAEEWDNVGLLVGDPSWMTSGAVISIDLNWDCIQLAQQTGYRLILNHHPCIFPKSRGLSKLTSHSPIFAAIQNGIAIAAYHTNFDQSALEVIETISKKLNISPMGRLVEKPSQSFLKLTTFVPSNYLEKVRTAICEAGAGEIGHYDYCTFGIQGEGTFRGSELTQPFIGKPGELERVQEVRLESILPKGLKENVEEALFRSHPYEEVAYDFFGVETSYTGKGIVKGLGYGFWGEFPNSRPFPEVAKDVRNLFSIDGFWVTPPDPIAIRRVGFVAGKGASFVDAALSLGCELFITGEAGYHTALGGSRRSMAVMELGHWESEKFFTDTMKTWLSELNLDFVEAPTPTQKIWT